MLKDTGVQTVVTGSGAGAQGYDLGFIGSERVSRECGHSYRESREALAAPACSQDFLHHITE